MVPPRCAGAFYRGSFDLADSGRSTASDEDWSVGWAGDLDSDRDLADGAAISRAGRLLSLVRVGAVFLGGRGDARGWLGADDFLFAVSPLFRPRVLFDAGFSWRGRGVRGEGERWFAWKLGSPDVRLFLFEVRRITAP